jgi:hypothetical protein
MLIFLCHSRYSRPDVLALGKYTLNLIGCSKDVSKEIYRMVEFLIPKVTEQYAGFFYVHYWGLITIHLAYLTRICFIL